MYLLYVGRIRVFTSTQVTSLSGSTAEKKSPTKPTRPTSSTAGANGLKPALSNQSLTSVGRGRAAMNKPDGSGPIGAKPPSRVATGFSVGDRVLVSGNKQGVIAFLGPTRFAKGEWAGVVLDEAVGKNDGSVQGVRYFDCAPNKGIFARPEKLEPVHNSPAMAAKSKETKQKQQQQQQQQAGHGNKGSLAAKRQQLQIGDHVVVGGAKQGILRYLGPTEFATGVWAGVELHEPVGKNDGSVAGKRCVHVRT